MRNLIILDFLWISNSIPFFEDSFFISQHYALQNTAHSVTSWTVLIYSLAWNTVYFDKSNAVKWQSQMTSHRFFKLDRVIKAYKCFTFM